MDKLQHPLRELFDQLGLPGDAAAIDTFIVRHAPLADHVPLAEAPFWTPQQARFLAEAVRDDADWAEIVDHLDVLLRRHSA